MFSFFKKLVGLSSSTRDASQQVSDRQNPKSRDVATSSVTPNSEVGKPKTKKKYSVYGNCQADPLGNILRTNPEFADGWEFVQFPKPSFELRKEDWPVVVDLMGQLDLFITQNVGESHGMFASENLQKQMKAGSQTIKIPNAYFSGYMPEVVYFRAGEPHVTQFCDYHDKNFLAHFMSDPVNAVEKTVAENLNVDTYSEELVISNAQKSIAELRRREQECDIVVSDYIAEHWRDDILFYSMNHPKRRVLSHIASNILKKIGQQTSDIKGDYEHLSNTRLPVYESVKSVLHPSIDWQIAVGQQEITLRDYYMGHAKVLRKLEPEFLRKAYQQFLKSQASS